MGYYVWIDIIMINQSDPEAADLSFLSRLIGVIGRTVLMVDSPHATVMDRLWCCWELWTTVKLQRTVFTVHLREMERADGYGEYDDADDDSSNEEEEKKLVVQDSTTSLLPLPSLETAKISSAKDKALLVTSFMADVESIKVGKRASMKGSAGAAVCAAGRSIPNHLLLQIKIKSLKGISREILQAAAKGTFREKQRPDLISKTYSALSLCKEYVDEFSKPTFSQLLAMRNALRAIIDTHYQAEGVGMVRVEDVEGEVAESMNFLALLFEEQREDAMWVSELQRFGKAAQTSYAKRFSSSYVDSLIHQCGKAGGSLKNLASYVQHSTRERRTTKSTSGLSEEDTEELEEEGQSEPARSQATAAAGSQLSRRRRGLGGEKSGLASEKSYRSLRL